MKYAKLVDGEWLVNPRKFNYNGKTYFNPKKKHYIAAGFLPVIETEMPEPSYDEYGNSLYMAEYEYGTGEQEGYVIQTWISID